jgi:predicted naringenin-chalcone synthase
VDVALMERLGLPPTAQRVHVGFMGCHGAVNGLRVAGAMAAADPAARVLLCCVELCSLHYAYDGDPQRIVANTLFADGAAAAVLAGPDGGTGYGEERSPWRLAATGSRVFPGSRDAMTWRIGDHGFEMTLSPRVPALIRENLRPWLDGWLESHGLRVEEVGSWALHPGGPRVLAAVAEALNLGGGAVRPSRQVLEEHGNMSSPTVLFILQSLGEEQAARPCVVLAFGPGLTAEAALLA